MIIEIDGEKHKIEKKTISYDEICNLAGYNPKFNPSMTGKPVGLEGYILRPGKIDTVKEGTRYDIAYTGNA